MIELVVFDWDGTLMDSRARIVHAMQRACAACEVAVPAPAAVCDSIGLDLLAAVLRIAPALAPTRAHAVAERYRHEYRAADDIPSPLYPGAAGMLASLAAGGRQLAIATGKSRAGLERALIESGLNGSFAASRTADECAAKPAPDMLLALLGELGVAPGAAVMVGDTTFDLAMARAARLAAVAVTHGAHDRARLVAAEPDLIIDALDELPSKLASFTAPTASTEEKSA